MSKTLIVLVGVPGSGKSAAALASGYPVVAPSQIRRSLLCQRFIGSAEPFVWAVARTMVEALLAVHDTVVLDACNVTERQRGDWISDRWVRRFVVFPEPEVMSEWGVRASDRFEPIGHDELGDGEYVVAPDSI